MKTAPLFLFVAAITAHLTCVAQVHVKGYTKKDGTYVAPYTRSAPSNSTGNNSTPAQTRSYPSGSSIVPPPSQTYVNNYNSLATSGSTAYAPSQQISLIPLIELKDGTKLRNVQITSTAATYVMARWEGGSGTIKLSDMPESALEIIYSRVTEAAVAPVSTQEPTLNNDVTTASEPVSPPPNPIAPASASAETPPQKASTDYSGVVVGLIVVLFLVVFVVLLVRNSRAEKKRRIEVAERATRNAERFQETIKQQKGLASVTSSLLLKKDEKAFFSAQSRLYETRSVRYGSGASFRVAKGVWLNSNSSESSPEWRYLDEGTLTITNKRLVFDGNQTNRSVNLDKVLSVNPSLDSAEISVDGRQKSFIVTVQNGLIFATIVIICRQVEDPEHIDPSKLKITYFLNP